jgi:hypothetical protein
MAVVHRPGPPGVRPDPPGVRPGPPSVRPDPSSVRTGNRQVLEIYVCIRGCSYDWNDWFNKVLITALINI